MKLFHTTIFFQACVISTSYSSATNIYPSYYRRYKDNSGLTGGHYGQFLEKNAVQGDLYEGSLLQEGHYVNTVS